MIAKYARHHGSSGTTVPGDENNHADKDAKMIGIIEMIGKIGGIREYGIRFD
jgi:hypothetical protein